jgi:Flp pilus assembly pilin Flp
MSIPRPRERSATMSAGIDKIKSLLRSEEGPTVTEYAVLIAVICVAVIGALSSFGVHMDNLYADINGTVSVFGS